MAAELQAAVADGQRDSYDTRLNTRIPGELDQRLRLPTVLSRPPLAHVLARLLSRQLPTEAELAVGCSRPEPGPMTSTDLSGTGTVLSAARNRHRKQVIITALRGFPRPWAWTSAQSSSPS
jgi:hypothetical protein